MTSHSTTDRRPHLVFLLLAVVLYLPFPNRPLRDAEAKYAEIPREMLARGEWTTPQLNLVPYLAKPPLTFWVTAGFYRVFGVHEWVARLANVLWAFLAAFLSGVLAERLVGKGHGLLTATLLLSTLGVYLYCLDAGIEFGLIAFLVLAFLFFWEFATTDSLVSLSLFYLSMGLGFMAKGLPGIVIPGTAAFLFLLYRRQAGRLVRLFHPVPVAILALTIGPWLALMTAKHPDFWSVFLVNEHLARFAGAMVSNDALLPTDIWLALVAAELFPWVVYLPLTATVLPRMVRAGAVAPERVVLLVLWAGTPLLLYACSRSKVDFYGLESYPALAILLSPVARDLLGNRTFSSARTWALPWLVVAPLAACISLIVFLQEPHEFARFEDFPSQAVAVFFLTATCLLSVGIAWRFRAEKVQSALLALLLLMATQFACLRTMFDAAFPYRSMKFAADSFLSQAQEGDLLISDERPEFEHVATLNYYAKRFVFLLRNRENSILHFIQDDQESMCIDEADIVQLYGEGRSIYLVGEIEKTRTRLARLGVGFEETAAAGRRALFRVRVRATQ